jgi:tRNA dimethylallyltransferase
LSRPIQHLALVGPTASGKSALALDAARILGDIEIVSMDSMQVYRGMDIGTAKPTRPDRAEIPHHVIDVIDPGEEWSVARFQEEARKAVIDIESRRHRALLVGGTGLYVQAIVDDLQFPGEDLELRAELEAATSEPGGIAAAHAELRGLDPEAASRIDEHNQRRIVRALEVIRITGRPFSSFGPGISQFGPTAFPVRMAGIWLPRAVLAVRIAARVASMRRDGLLDEARALRARGLSRTAAQAIGYREAFAVVDGEAEPDDAFATAARRTRSFARRQRMWFRRDPRITWLGTGENPAALLPALLAAWTP